MENKKKIAAAVAAAIAASGAAVDASIDNPADILQQDVNQTPQVQYVGADGDQDNAAGSEEKQRQETAAARAGSLQEWILQLPLAVRTVVVLPLWCVGHLINMAGSLLFAGLSPVLQYVLSFLLMALVIGAAFTAAAKAMFPDLPLGKILNRHTIKWILIAAAAAWLADLLLGIFWSGYAQMKRLILAIFTLAAIGSVVVWFARREHRRRDSLCMEEAEELPEEIEYTSLGQTFRVRVSEEEHTS